MVQVRISAAFMVLGSCFVKYFSSFFCLGVLIMANSKSVFEAKNALRQQIKARLSRISIEDKLVQSDYVADKVSKFSEKMYRLY